MNSNVNEFQQYLENNGVTLQKDERGEFGTETFVEAIKLIERLKSQLLKFEDSHSTK